MRLFARHHRARHARTPEAAKGALPTPAPPQAPPAESDPQPEPSEHPILWSDLLGAERDLGYYRLPDLAASVWCADVAEEDIPGAVAEIVGPHAHEHYLGRWIDPVAYDLMTSTQAQEAAVQYLLGALFEARQMSD